MRAFLAGLMLLVFVAVPGRSDPAPQTQTQNIVLILTDDQRWDSLQYMPNVESLLAAHGVTFTNAFDNNPLCCPTRTTIMTGLTSGHNGVWANDGFDSVGGFKYFLSNGDENRQIFGWLHDAGYQTALIGKFLNGYLGPGGSESDVSWVLPGVDDWQVFLQQPSDTSQCGTDGYWQTCYSNDGVLETEPPDAYSTQTSGDKAVSFIEGADPAKPLFLYYAPKAPHLPTLPEPQYADACSNVPKIRGPSYNRPLVNGPEYMTAIGRWNKAERVRYDGLWRADCQTLLSVDDQVKRIVSALQDTGRLANTLIVFASDNGFAFGEHRWNTKIVPYDPSIRVPIVIRDDAVIGPAAQGTSSNQQITSLDYAPTFLEAAGLSRPLDGESIFPLLGDGTWTRQNFVLIEGANSLWLPVSIPAYCGVRTPRFMYTRYSTGEEELYDLTVDPEELVNVAGMAGYRRAVKRLRSRARTLCDPTPPDFSWSTP